MLLISHGSVIWGPCSACKGQFFHTLTLIWLVLPQKEKSLSSMLFLGISTRLGIWSSTNRQEYFLLISVNFSLNHCTKVWVRFSVYYLSHCVIYSGLKKTSKTRRIMRQSTSCPFFTENHQSFTANRLLAFWKVHCTGNKILTIAYAADCSWLLLLQLPPFYLTWQRLNKRPPT